MKFQTTLAFTLLLLIAMVGAGTVSALYGFTLGYEALKGVKQPEGNPSQQLVRSRKSNDPKAAEIGIQLLSEKKLIAAVYDKIHSQEQTLKKQKPTPKEQPKSSFVKLPDQELKSGEKSKGDQVNAVFPLVTKSAKVALEVTNGRLLGSYWVMDINLQNNGRQSVNFLYNFLEIKDDQGQLMSAETEGLPAEIPANNQKYSGKIRIPAVILDQSKSKSLSLQLQDYPDQEISLEISDIPVVR